jgi:hypothetical protein
MLRWIAKKRYEVPVSCYKEGAVIDDIDMFQNMDKE